MAAVGKTSTENLILALAGEAGPAAFEQAIKDVGALRPSSAQFKKLKQVLDARLGDEFKKRTKSPAELVQFLQLAQQAKSEAAKSQVDVQAESVSRASAGKKLEGAVDQIIDGNSAFAEANKGKRPAGEQDLIGAMSDLQKDLKRGLTPDQEQAMREHMLAQMQPGMPLGDQLMRVDGMSEISRLLNSRLPIELILVRVMILLARESDDKLQGKLKELEEANSSERKKQLSHQQATAEVIESAQATEETNKEDAAKAAAETAGKAVGQINQAEQPAPTEKAAEDKTKKDDTKRDDVRAASTSGKPSVDNRTDATPTDAGDAKPTQAPPTPEAPRKSQQAILTEVQYLQQQRSEMMSMLNNIMQQLHQMAMDIIQKIGR